MCPGDEKTGYLHTTWQALPWAWYSISQHLETWEHLLSTRGEQSWVTSNPSIHILFLCGWLHCCQHTLGRPECKQLHPPCKHSSVSACAAVLPYTNCQWSTASTCFISSTHSGPKSVQHSTRPIPVTAIKESLKTLHLSPARTVGAGNYSWRKGGLAGLSLGWCWVFSTPTTDHTWGSSDLTDGSGIRINVKRSFKSSFSRLLIHLLYFSFFCLLNCRSVHFSSWQLKREEFSQDRAVTSLFSRAAVRLQVQIQSHAGLVRNPFQSQSPHYTHGSLCHQKVTCITWVTQYVSEIFLTLLKNLHAQKRGFHSSITILFTHDNSLIKSYVSCRRFYMLI